MKIPQLLVAILLAALSLRGQLATENVVITGNVDFGVSTGVPSIPDPDPIPELPITGIYTTGVSLGTNSPTTNVNGVQLLGYSDALTKGLTVTNGSPFRNTSYGFTVTPTPDTGTASLILGGVWRNGFNLAPGNGFRLSQTVGNGVYDYYFWSLENFQSNSRTYDVKLEGNTVASAVGAIPLGRWQRFGPYRVTVTDGTLDADFLKVTGDPQICGFALFAIPQFSKAVNLGTSASAVTYNGNTWQSHTAASSDGMTITNGTLYGPISYGFTLNPTPSPTEQSILAGGVYRENPGPGSGFTIDQTISSGRYQVYIWSIENYQSNYRDENFFLESTQVATGVGNFPVGGWQRYGPYDTVVNDGKLTISIAQATKGDPQINAFEIYKLYSVPDAVVIPPDPVDPGAGGDTPPANAISVANYGANLADNGTDDRQAIINAMNAVPAGGTLYFPPGTYNLGGSITMRCGINYMGVRTQSIIKQNSGFHIFQWFFPSSCSNMLVSSLVFDVNGVVGVGNFGFESTTKNIEFRWNVFKNQKTDNVCCNDRIFRFVGASDTIKIHHNIFGPAYVSTNAAGRGLGSLTGIFWHYRPSNIQVTDNYFNKIGEPIHSYCQDDNCEFASTISNFNISRNVFIQYQDIAVEIQIHVKDSIFEDNWIGNIYNPNYSCNIPGQPDTGSDGSFNGIDCGNMGISNAQGSDQNTRIARNIILGNWQKEDGTKGVNGAGWGIEWSTGPGNPPGTFKSEIFGNKIINFSRFGVDYGNGMQPTQGNNAPIFGRFNTFHDNVVCGGSGYGGNYNAGYAGSSQLLSQGNTWAATCPQNTWDAIMQAYPPPPPPFNPSTGVINGSGGGGGMANTFPYIKGNFLANFSANAVGGQTEPAVGASVTDTEYQSSVTKTVAASSIPSSANVVRPSYMRWTNDNADGSKYFVFSNAGSQQLNIYNSSNDSFFGKPTWLSHENNEPRWDDTNPNIIYHVTNCKLQSTDIVSALNTSTDVHDFAVDYPGCQQITNGGEGTSSIGNRYWTWMVRGNYTHGNYYLMAVVVYDKQSNTIVGSLDRTKYLAQGGNADLWDSGGYAPNMVDIAPSGDRVLLLWPAIKYPSPDQILLNGGGDQVTVVSNVATVQHGRVNRSLAVSDSVVLQTCTGGLGGTWPIASKPTDYSTTITVSGVANGTYSCSYMQPAITSIVVSGGTATATTGFNHRLTVGETPQIQGATSGALNATVTVASVPTARSFTFATAAANGTYTPAAGGGMVLRWREGVKIPDNNFTYAEKSNNTLPHDAPHVYAFNFNSSTKVCNDETHSGWGWTSAGNAAYICQINGGNWIGADADTVGFTDIYSGVYTPVFYHADLSYQGGFHFGRFYNTSIKGWGVMAYASDPGDTNKLVDSLVFFQLKKWDQNPVLWRAAKLHNTHYNYDTEAHGSLTRDAQKFYWGANWNGNSGHSVDTYKTTLPTGWWL